MSRLNDQARLRRMLAESEIRELAARFSDAVTRGDVEAFRALWTDDAVWEIREPYPSRAEGLPAIVFMLQRLAEPFAFFVQLTHGGVVEFESESSAIARWEMREVARSIDGQRSYDNLAIYDDRVVRRFGRHLAFLEAQLQLHLGERLCVSWPVFPSFRRH